VKNLSLRHKLALSYAAAITLVIIVFAVAFIALQNVQAYFSRLSSVSIPLVEDLDEIKFVGARVISSTNEYLLDVTLGLEEADEKLEQVVESREQYNQTLDSIRSLMTLNIHDATDDGGLVVSIENAGQKLFDIVDEILVMAENGAPTDDIAELREKLEPAEIEFLAAVEAALNEENDELSSSSADVEWVVTTATSTLAVLIVIGAALTVLGVVYFSRSFLLPLSHLHKVAIGLKDGDLKVRGEAVSNDEFGQLALALNSMAEQLEMQMAILEDQLLETEEARAEAVRSDQVKSAFLASMSHELRTPLNAVINFTRFVMDGDTGPVNEEQVELLSQVVMSAKHLLNLINDVLDMSKIEAGALNLFIEDDINLNALLKNAVGTGQALLADKSVSLSTEIDDELPLIRGDRQRILQIILNIVSNACKFTEQGEIKVIARRDKDEIVVVVDDTGPGIKLEDQAMVFEAFKQTQTGLRQGSGTGLGMPIARSLAEAHGGRLWLESEYGNGTKFYVALPIQSESLVPVMA